jgi:hypothetical protein
MRGKPQTKKYSRVFFSKLGISSPLEMPMDIWVFMGVITKGAVVLRLGKAQTKKPPTMRGLDGWNC